MNRWGNRVGAEVRAHDACAVDDLSVAGIASQTSDVWARFTLIA